MLKKLLITSLLVISNIKCAFGNEQLSNDKTLITVNQFVSHPALDATVIGLNSALLERGISPDKVAIKTANANGNIATCVQISIHQASLKPTIMVGIATPSAQSILKAKAKDTILAFVAVSDPHAAGLDSAKNAIGVSDNPPLEDLIETTLKILPNIKTIGVLYNPSEINSVKTLEKLEIIAKPKNIKIIKVGVNSSNEVKNATSKFKDLVDVIYIPQDNTVVSAINSITKFSLEHKIPVIANDTMLIKQGVFFALGSDYFQSGVQLGNMIADHIEGKKLDQNIQESKVKDLKINKEVAENFGISIPANLKGEYTQSDSRRLLGEQPPEYQRAYLFVREECQTYDKGTCISTTQELESRRV